MKKLITTTLFVLLIAMLIAAPASAQKGKVNIKGEVTAIDGNTLTIESNKGDTFTVTAPADFDMSSVEVGSSVLIKGSAAEDDSIEADSIKVVGKANDNGKPEKEEKEKPEGFKDNSAFCAADKQDKLHPLAAKMAERFDVSEEWVMEKVCDGYSIGAIMLAVKTGQMSDGDPEDLLANRADGNGWGLIWKNLGLIGSEKSGDSPPGWLKRPDHAGPKDK
jgi:hypothetical protein